MRYQNVAVSAFILHEGKALIVQRATNEDFLPNKWEQVGGKVEWGENPFGGLVREVKEESGLEVQPVQTYWVWSYTPQGERQTIEVAVMCEIVGGAEVTLSSEHQAYRWATEEEVRALSDADITKPMREEILAGFEFLRRWQA